MTPAPIYNNHTDLACVQLFTRYNTYFFAGSNRCTSKITHKPKQKKYENIKNTAIRSKQQQNLIHNATCSEVFAIHFNTIHKFENWSRDRFQRFRFISSGNKAMQCFLSCCNKYWPGAFVISFIYCVHSIPGVRLIQSIKTAWMETLQTVLNAAWCEHL